MSTISAGARRLPLHHVTIRVPWHDGGWNGTLCARPLDNSSCLILPRIGEGRRDDVRPFLGRRIGERGPASEQAARGRQPARCVTFSWNCRNWPPVASQRASWSVSRRL